MKIENIVASVVSIPLTRPYVIARGAVESFTNVVVEVTTTGGISGFGEAVPISVVGDCNALLGVIDTRFRPMLIGRDPSDIVGIVETLLAACDGQVAAVAGIDLALWDIAGKVAAQPVRHLLGSQADGGVAIDYTMSVDRPEAMAETARAAIAALYRGVVVKVPCRSVDEDVARVEAVRSVVPETASMRVDCNGGYARQEAIDFLRRVSGLGLEFVEQPVAAGDLEGLAACRGQGVAIAADESLNTLPDARALIESQACDVLNVKVTKAGGLLQSKRIADMALAAGLPLVVGGGLTFGISRFASQQIAVACPAAAGRCHQGPGPASQALPDDIVEPHLTRRTITESGGVLTPPPGPGLGFSIDRARLDRYRVA